MDAIAEKFLRGGMMSIEDTQPMALGRCGAGIIVCSSAIKSLRGSVQGKVGAGCGSNCCLIRRSER